MTEIVNKPTAAEALAAAAPVSFTAVPPVHLDSAEVVSARFASSFRRQRRIVRKLNRADLETLAAELLAAESEWKRHADYAIFALHEVGVATSEAQARSVAAEAQIALRQRKNSLGGKAAHQRTRAAKSDVYLFWRAWQSGKCKSIKSKTQFASTAQARSGNAIKARETILRWMRGWESETTQLVE